MPDLATVAERKQALDEARPLPVETAEAVSLWFETELMLAEAELEGIEISRDEVERLVSGEAGGLLSPAAAEIANLKAALAWVGGRIDNEIEELSADTVKLLHRTLRRGLAEDAGTYRKTALRQDRTDEESGASAGVILPKPGALPMLMARIGSWLRTAEPAPETAAEAHYRLLRVQPFAERNQTVARLLMNLVLGLGGYPPVIIRSEHMLGYRHAIDVALGQQNKKLWQAFFLERLVDSLDVCLLAAAKPLAERVADAAPRW